ncbi:MAG TPA: SHOCT domain-containing protein [Candidatus Binatia bacterium]|jgi:putative membrane protein
MLRRALLLSFCKEATRKQVWYWPFLLAGWLTPDGVLAQGRFYEWHWEMHPMWWWGWGLGMMAMMFLFWVLVIVGLIIGVRWLLGISKQGKSDSAMEILRQRYARGEINKDEFEAKKKDLGG